MRPYRPRLGPRGCALLLVANVFNIAADLSGMADAVEMLAGVSSHVSIPIFGALLLFVTVYTSYRTFAKYLKWPRPR